jgi:proteic killer suppression protein
MIKSFKHKGLKEIFDNGETSKLPQERLDKIKKLLFVIHNAHQLEDINTPGSRLHKLKAPPYAGWYSVDVTANYRIVFQFTNGNVYDIDYADTH